jgi:hypothetical protein
MKWLSHSTLASPILTRLSRDARNNTVSQHVAEFFETELLAQESRQSEVRVGYRVVAVFEHNWFHDDASPLQDGDESIRGQEGDYLSHGSASKVEFDSPELLITDGATGYGEIDDAIKQQALGGDIVTFEWGWNLAHLYAHLINLSPTTASGAAEMYVSMDL